MINADEILFHPSALGKIMTGVAKKWSVDDSLTCKRELVRIHREIKYSRYYVHHNKYTEKGIKMEQDAITLYSRFRKKVLKKNDKRIQNKFFDGEPDIIIPKETVDVKCSWSLETFPHKLTDTVDKDYEYQGRGYIDLCDADKHTVAYCLVNAPANLIIKEKEKLWYAMNCPDETNELYVSERIRIEKNMIFDAAQFVRDNPNYDWDCHDWQYDIPIEERIVEFAIERNDMEAMKIKDRITDCRSWMNTNLFKLQLQPTH